MKLKITANGFLMSALLSIGGIAHAANTPALLENTAVSAAVFPQAWAATSMMDRNAMDLGDGSVGMLGAVKLPSSAMYMKASRTVKGAGQARDYFLSILGKSGRNVELTSTATTEDNGEVTAYMVQTVNGVRINGTYATATMRGDTLTYSRHFFVQAPALDTTPFVTVEDAQTVAVNTARAEAEAAEIAENSQSELRIVFHNGQAKLAWAVQVLLTRPSEAREIYVDAQNGDFLSYERTSHHDVEGHVNFKVETDCVGGPTEELPVPYVKWNGADYTDGQGAFVSTKDIASAKVSLESPFFKLQNMKGRLAGPWAAPLVAGADNDVTVEDRAMEQLDPFYHLHNVRAWVRKNIVGKNLQTAWTDKQVTVKVNMNDTCNAYYYAGTVNFFAAGDGCLNTSRTSGIVYHEYGHSVHDHSVPSNSALRMNGQVSEGVGDYIAATITGNNLIHGITSCRDNFRNTVNNFSYCDSGCTFGPKSEVHNAGQVIAGTWWEVRTNLIKRYGKADGVATSDRLFLKFLTKVGNMNSAYQAAIAADDDNDNDPTNGTVHSCEINRAFANDTPGAKMHFPRLKGHLVPCEAHSQ